MSHTPQSEPKTGISIIIPVRGRLGLLRRLLESINDAKARLPSAIGYEVIVVWDGLEDPCTEVTEFSKRTDLVCRCLFLQAGQAMKRNVGMASAQYSIALCVDSDCTVHANLLKRVAETFMNTNTHAFAVPVEFEPSRGLLETAIAIMPYRQAFHWAESGEGQWWSPAATIALRLSTVKRFGGFSSVARGPDRGEDVDLGLRWTKRLGQPAIVTDPTVPSHHTRQTWVGWLKALERSWRFGASEGPLWQRHADFRRYREPPLLLIALVSIAIATVLSALSVWPWGLLLIGFLSLIGWFALEVNMLLQSGLPIKALPAGLLLFSVFEVARTLSLWRAGTLTGALWFHHRQPIGSWKFLSWNAWLLLIFGLLMWLSSIISGR